VLSAIRKSGRYKQAIETATLLKATNLNASTRAVTTYSRSAGRCGKSFRQFCSSRHPPSSVETAAERTRAR
jgi:hypothetical protein